MKESFILFVLVLFAVVLVNPALARDTFHELSVKKALTSQLGKEKLLNVPIYMAGQKHKRMAKDLGVFKSNKRSRSFDRTDVEACNVAFLSAVISLQKRALKMGADAVVDIRSITKDKRLISATKFRCVAGDIMANVALTGRMVNFK